MIINTRDIALGWSLLLFCLLGTPVALAGNDAGQDRWEYIGELFLWGAGMGGTTAEGDDIDISFDDVLDDLEFALMGTLGARKGKWSLIADVIYLDLEDDIRTTANLINQPVAADINVEMEGLTSTLLGAYRVMENDTTSLDILAGARYLKLEADLFFNIGGGLIQQSYSDSGHVWDGIVGFRGATDLNSDWYVHYYLDAGAGDSDLTWQALGGINYRFKKVDAVLGYAHLEWDFDDDDTFDDLNFSGPYIGIKSRF
jgi:hypothetical protein